MAEFHPASQRANANLNLTSTETVLVLACKRVLTWHRVRFELRNFVSDGMCARNTPQDLCWQSRRVLCNHVFTFTFDRIVVVMDPRPEARNERAWMWKVILMCFPSNKKWSFSTPVQVRFFSLFTCRGGQARRTANWLWPIHTSVVIAQQRCDCKVRPNRLQLHLEVGKKIEETEVRTQFGKNPFHACSERIHGLIERGLLLIQIVSLVRGQQPRVQVKDTQHFLQSSLRFGENLTQRQLLIYLSPGSKNTRIVF